MRYYLPDYHVKCIVRKKRSWHPYWGLSKITSYWLRKPQSMEALNSNKKLFFRNHFSVVVQSYACHRLQCETLAIMMEVTVATLVFRGNEAVFRGNIILSSSPISVFVLQVVFSTLCTKDEAGIILIRRHLPCLIQGSCRTVYSCINF